MKTVSMALPASMPSSHLWVPSVEGLSNTTAGGRISQRSSSLDRSALPTSVMLPSSVSWRWYIHFISWCARNFFSPSSASKKRSIPARSRSNRLSLPVTGAALPDDASAMAEPTSILGSAITSGMRLSVMRRASGCRARSARAKFGGAEEIGGFDRGVLDRVRTVHGVGVDGLREVGADRARRGVLRVGGAHQVAVLLHRRLAFEHLDHHRAGDHELDQRAEERPLAMHGVEALGLAARQVLHLRRDDLQAGRLESRIDLADDVLGDRVGLDDGNGALQR